MINMFGETVRMTDKFTKAIAYQSHYTGMSVNTILFLASLTKHKAFYKALEDAGHVWDGQKWQAAEQEASE